MSTTCSYLDAHRDGNYNRHVTVNKPVNIVVKDRYSRIIIKYQKTHTLSAILRKELRRIKIIFSLIYNYTSN